MRDRPDHHDAELLLRLYDLRREEKFREAREWFIREFQAESLDEFQRRYPRGGQENTFFRMVVSYWDMAASIVNNGLIHEDFFFQNTSEFWVVWSKLGAMVPSARQAFKDPHLWEGLETLAGKYERWMAKRAPEALESHLQRILQATAKTRG